MSPQFPSISSLSASRHARPCGESTKTPSISKIPPWKPTGVTSFPWRSSPDEVARRPLVHKTLARLDKEIAGCEPSSTAIRCGLGACKPDLIGTTYSGHAHRELVTHNPGGKCA